MKQIRTEEHSENIVYAYEPDKTLRKLIGENVPIANIFTAEKILECQKIVDEAKLSFFETSQVDIDSINKIVCDPVYAENYLESCKQIHKPVCNIKGQADIFGFKLISDLCKHLIEYCQAALSHDNFTGKEAKLVLKLANALEKAFKERITGSGGAVEKELIKLVSQNK